MVFLILHKKYTGFANVRRALIPQDDGQAGELRLTKTGYIQHRIYNPAREIQEQSYLSIPSKIICIDRTHIIGCDLRIVTVQDCDHWLRFPSDSDAIIFARLLSDRDDLGCGRWMSEWLRPSNYSNYDNWEGGPWTENAVASNDLECRCNHIGLNRYLSDYQIELQING